MLSPPTSMHPAIQANHKQTKPASKAGDSYCKAPLHTPTYKAATPSRQLVKVSACSKHTSTCTHGAGAYANICPFQGHSAKHHSSP